MADREQLWGWLDQGDHDPLAGKELAEKLLLNIVGLASFEKSPAQMFVANRVRPTRLSDTLIEVLSAQFSPERFSIDGFARANHSLGQSYPDQLMRRACRIENPIDASVQPHSADDALALLRLASQYKFSVMAAGGATNVTGGFSIIEIRPVVAADMRKLNRLLAINEIDMTVEVESGIRLPELEAALGARGFTLGHFPQSFHGASIGGSIAAHGSGQRSNGYGRMSDLLISAKLATPSGLWETEDFRHAATGPWLGGLVCGSEGLFGLIVSVKLRIKRKPQFVEDRGWFMPSFSAASDVVRQLVQADAGLSMIRVSNASETGFLGQFRLAMKGMDRSSIVERMALKMKRAPAKPVLIIAGIEGNSTYHLDVIIEAERAFKRAGAISLGKSPGASWRKSRYDLPYLRESLLRRGIGVDTFETTVPWIKINEVHEKVSGALEMAMNGTLAKGKSAVMCHLSHSYPEAACLYFTAIFPQSHEPLRQWQIIKAAVMKTFAECGVSASHHHGVGSDHAEAVALGKGQIGMSVLKSIKSVLDPENVLVSGMTRMYE